MKHTKTPWNFVETGYKGSSNFLIKNKTGQLIIAEVNSYASDEETKANAELIVKAVNSHYELLEVANELVKGYEVGMGKSAIQLRIDLLKQAIQNAQ